MSTPDNDRHEDAPRPPVPGDGGYVWGLPAFLIASLGVGLVLAGQHHGEGMELFEQYLKQAHASVEAEDYAVADVYYRKLSYLKLDDPGIQYGLACTAEQQGNLRRAHSLMKRIAPVDSTGFAAAHFWQAQKMAERSGITTDEMHELRHHLESTLALDVHNAEAHALLAVVLVKMKANELALSHLRTACETLPRYRVLLARVHARDGDITQATHQARLAADHYQRVVERTPENAIARHKWADAELLVGRLAKVAEGEKYFDNGRIRDSLISFYCHWWDTLDGQDAKRPKLLQRAMRYAPNHPAVIERASRSSPRAGDDGDNTRMAVDELPAAGRAPGVGHLILGAAAIADEDWPKALLHTEQAVRLLPNSIQALNNLAWLYGQSEDPERLNEALKLADKGVKLVPWFAEMRETRGQILAKLKRWKDALTDLEIALGELPDRPEIRLTLANVYEALDRRDVAAGHRERARALAARPEQSFRHEQSEETVGHLLESAQD